MANHSDVDGVGQLEAGTLPRSPRDPLSAFSSAAAAPLKAVRMYFAFKTTPKTASRQTERAPFPQQRHPHPTLAPPPSPFPAPCSPAPLASASKVASAQGLPGAREGSLAEVQAEAEVGSFPEAASCSPPGSTSSGVPLSLPSTGTLLPLFTPLRATSGPSEGSDTAARAGGTGEGAPGGGEDKPKRDSEGDEESGEEAKREAVRRVVTQSMSVNYRKRGRMQGSSSSKGGPQGKVAGCAGRLCQGCEEYISKWSGTGEGIFPPYPTLNIAIWSFIACFVGMATMTLVFHYVYLQLMPSSANPNTDIGEVMTIAGVFASSAILLYGTVDAPESQPRNFILGMLLSLGIGIGVTETFHHFGYGLHQDPTLLWLQMALAVSLSLTAMQATRTLHAPGGTAAVLVVLLPPAARHRGILLLLPALVALFTLLLVALLLNNIARQYPLYWWKPQVAATVITENLGEDQDFELFGEAFQAGKLSFNPRKFPGLEEMLGGEHYEPPVLPSRSRAELERAMPRARTAPLMGPRISWLASPSWRGL